MSPALKIEISDEPTAAIVHRFRNFGEDVYRALQGRCAVSIEEIDAFTTSFTVRDIHRRELRSIIKIIENELKRHRFDQTATLTLGQDLPAPRFGSSIHGLFASLAIAPAPTGRPDPISEGSAILSIL